MKDFYILQNILPFYILNHLTKIFYLKSIACNFILLQSY